MLDNLAMVQGSNMPPQELIILPLFFCKILRMHIVYTYMYVSVWNMSNFYACVYGQPRYYTDIVFS